MCSTIIATLQHSFCQQAAFLQAQAVVLDLYIFTLGEASCSVLHVQYNHSYLVAQLLPTVCYPASPSVTVRF